MNLKINFVARAKNRLFWVTLIPAVLLLIQAVAAIFGLQLDLTEMQAHILAAVDALFAVLAVLGIVTDPTTDGVSDSEQALAYTEPRRDDAGE